MERIDIFYDTDWLYSTFQAKIAWQSIPQSEKIRYSSNVWFISFCVWLMNKAEVNDVSVLVV
ncbi:hypothetical protein KSX_05180 [Ktedonospora formicarum]|uniref:Uncharacterized protein n=1 Tax=Ktedonospora formicarum TaxID=2778364 RepID=A0A8J3MNX3_9CHLR|nr:hypothetical protein KSX_05180 [Ktedonospora formicarum]